MARKRLLLFVLLPLAAALLLAALLLPFGKAEVELPVLLYHHLGDNPGEMTVTPERFALQIAALRDAGYHAVTAAQLVAFVESGTPLPKNPVLITFDDGYSSNLELAAPILEKYGMCATVFVIGVSVGRDTYKDTDHPILPHFTFAEAAEWDGVIEVQSHSYDMHQLQSLDGADCREGVLPLPGEDPEDYAAAVRADFSEAKAQLEAGLGTAVYAYAYPFGVFTAQNDTLLSEMGVRLTCSTEPGINTITQGLPQCLFALKRLYVYDDTTPENLLSMMASA